MPRAASRIKQVKVKFSERAATKCRELWAALTPQERNVAKLMTVGKSNKQIADELGISLKTLDIHRLNTKEKLGVDSLTGIPIVVLAALGKIRGFEL
jgi:DNA-binding CsgD family transcriptional regulator